MMVVKVGAQDIAGSSVLWDNILAAGVVTWSSQTADGAALNVTEVATSDYWTPSAVPAWVAVDMGAGVSVNGAGIAAHNLGTVGATVAIQSSDNGSTWVTRETATPTDDGAIFFALPNLTARYWRVYVTGAVASIGVAFIGQRLTFPSGVLSGHLAINNAKQYKLLNSQTIGGHYLGNRKISTGASTNINFGLVRSERVETELKPFIDYYNSGGAFFYAGSPLNWPNDIGYCWRPAGDGGLRPVYEAGGKLANISLEVNAYVR